LAKINYQNYLENLIDNILNSFNNPNVTINVQTNENDFDIDTSIPLGLIINELVCNSLKHAFPGYPPDNDRTISIQLYKKENELYLLEIGDNGVGRPDTINNSNSSLGLEIVSLLVKQLKGTMQLLEKKGTNYLIEFTEITKQQMFN
jgi:two-component sensor histidine kinase